MRFFVCILEPTGGCVSDEARHAYDRFPRSRELKFRWESLGELAVLTAGDDLDWPPVAARYGDVVAVGSVRLDNRTDLERWSECDGQSFNDLELVLRTVARHGDKYVPQFLGDFAFLVWNPATRTAVAACDAFAARKMYYAERNGLFAFASRAEALALDDRYEVRCLAELVAMCSLSPELSVYAGVWPVPAATIARIDHGRLTKHQYWSPEAFATNPAWATSEQEAVDTCRALLVEAVRLRLSGTGDTWAQLSGGMDSSAVVCIAQWLVERGAVAHGLSGTVTYVDRQGTVADEREYSNAVSSGWRLRNETIVDPPIWFDSRHALPRGDQPRFTFHFYPRERQLCAIVRAAGGRVLLTGAAGDSLFTGTMFFFADWLACGRVRPAIREMARWAAVGRVSFWDLAYRNALLPLLPRALQQLLLRDDAQVPRWMLSSAMRRYGLRGRGFVAQTYGGRIGHKYRHAVNINIAEQGISADFGIIGEELDVRHPFLYRPLVEFALQLPPELCARPQARKWVLREAMRGILPDIVRTRIGKGSPAELYASSLITHRSLLEPLLHDPILAELGIIDATKLRAAFYAAPQRPQRRDQWHAVVQTTLMVEAWLQMRSGRWPNGGHHGNSGSSRTRSPFAVTHPSPEGNPRRDV